MSAYLKSMRGDVNKTGFWFCLEAAFLLPLTAKQWGGIRLKSGFKHYKFWIQSRWEGEGWGGDFCMRNVWGRKVVFKWWWWRGGGESDESLTPRNLIPVTLKPQRNNDITPSFQDRESKHCSVGPSLCTHTHTSSHQTIRPHFECVYVHVTIHRHGNKRRSGWELLISRTRFDFQACMPTISFMLDILLKATHVKCISQWKVDIWTDVTMTYRFKHLITFSPYLCFHS